jgi:spermidine synthase
VAANDPLHRREPDARAREFRHAVQSLKRPEEPVRVLRSEAGSVVAHEIRAMAVFAAPPKFDPRAVVLRRILPQKPTELIRQLLAVRAVFEMRFQFRGALRLQLAVQKAITSSASNGCAFVSLSGFQSTHFRSRRKTLFDTPLLCADDAAANVKLIEQLGQTLTRDGTVMKLVRRDDEYIILANGKSLMSSRMHGSEEALATLACTGARTMKQPRVLIGGLGMGFTLRAALDVLPRGARVTVAERVPAVVAWNRGPLGPLAAEPLKASRVRVEIDDVAVTLGACRDEFDAVLLDVDNGPTPFAGSSNAGLYDDRGIAMLFAALKTDGVLAVWSAHEDRKFEQRLRRGKFAVQVETARARLKKGGPRHTIFLGRKTAKR